MSTTGELMTDNAELIRNAINLYSSMDWSYMMSDDSGVYNRGRAAKAALIAALNAIGLDGVAVYDCSWKPVGKMEIDGKVVNCRYYRESALALMRAMINKEEEVTSITTTTKTIDLSTLTESVRARVLKVEALRQAVTENPWDVRVYRHLQLKSGEADGKKFHNIRWNYTGELTNSQRKTWLNSLAKAMQDQGWTTDRRGVNRLICTKCAD